MKSRFTFAKITSVGNRKINEDSIGIFTNNDRLGFVLCDGLGGHGLGDVASKLFVDVFQSEFENQGKSKEIILKTFDCAQEKILSEQTRLGVPDKIKTTAVVAIFDGQKLHISHVGDSRAYVFNKGKVLKRTLDHSIPQMLALSKEISDSEIRNHPDRNMLLRVMGTEWHEKQYEFMKPISLKKVQALLLCSDGFWELIDENCMCQALEDATSVQEWLDTMVGIVEINGKDRNMDNFSAIAVWNQRM